MSLRAGYGLIGVALIALIAGGCTVNGPEDGSASDSPRPMPSPGGNKSSLDLPPRPHDLKVAGMQDQDICTLLTPEQQAQLKVTRPTPNAGFEAAQFPGCGWLSPPEETDIGIGVSVVPEGIEQFQTKKFEPSKETAAVYTVAGGFGALQAQAPGAESTGCVVDVDVAEGQTLEVNLALLESGGMNKQQMCATAKQAAEMAVTTLQSQA